MNSKRKNLGFDDSSDDETHTSVPNLCHRKKYKVPKFVLKADDVANTESDGDDERPTLTTETHQNDTEETDYLNMSIVETDDPESQKGKTRTYNNQSKSKEEEGQERLRKSLFGQILREETDPSIVLKPLPNQELNKTKSKGLSIMEKMGFKVGDTLGKTNDNKNAILEPIIPVANTKRSGVKEKHEISVGKEIDERDMSEFRNRLNKEKTEAKQLKTVRHMQKYCYEFSGDAEQDIRTLNLLDINVLWRGYVKYIKGLLEERTVTNAIDDDEAEVPEEERETENVAGSESGQEDEEDEDLELSFFEELPVADQLQRLNLHLRSEYDYCFYCGVKYTDQQDLFENCPGDLEEDHA